MKRREILMGCEVEKHHPACPCQGCKPQPQDCTDCKVIIEKQHEVPICIGRKLLKVKESELNKYAIPASAACHALEDMYVEPIFKDMKEFSEKTGIIFTIENVREIRDLGLFRGKPEQVEIIRQIW